MNETTDAAPKPAPAPYSPGRLRYNSFSIVYMQVFSVERFDRSLVRSGFFEPKDPADSVDRQIFMDPSPVERYTARGFDFSLTVEKPEDVRGIADGFPDRVRVEGRMAVDVSVFFGRTVSVTYRMVVDGKNCRRDGPVSTDCLISLSSLSMGAEHWSYDAGKKLSTINLDIPEMRIGDLYLDGAGGWLAAPVSLDGVPDCGFVEAQQRYKRMIAGSNGIPGLRDIHYVYVDVWEDVEHTGGLFREMTEPQIVSHIFHRHRPELIGLMSLYPYEWPYRAEECFGEVCGANVAIDTDDLILVNQNMCLVVGTYGLRGEEAPTNWRRHLEERAKYHVSWPEYLLVLEMVLARKYTVAAALDLFLGQAQTLCSQTVRRTRRAIECNARRGLELTELLLELDAVKYSRYVSHKLMFERTARRLEVDKETGRLNASMEKIDRSLFNISEMRKLRQTMTLNLVLGTITAASLLGILFNRVEMPFLHEIGMDRFSGAGLYVILLVLALLVGSPLIIALNYFKNNKN